MALHLDALKTPVGYLKIVHTILGAVALGLISYYSSTTYMETFTTFNIKYPSGIGASSPIFFFIIVSFAFLLTSFLLLWSVLAEKSDESVPKSYFECVYHLFGFIFIFSASICLIVTVSRMNYLEKYMPHYKGYIAAVIAGMFNSFAYLLNWLIAYKSRGGCPCCI